MAHTEMEEGSWGRCLEVNLWLVPADGRIHQAPQNQNMNKESGIASMYKYINSEYIILDDVTIF